ncbi:DMT family transporter [Gloeothece verrucosa]|uniref:EamA domain-containing protein n=1 Tax=Gloeothece verrucosa (strain PCC 7822) TaxID=497965 RepID=E0ULD2_GLOV7|nr:DMT family transporter [Gloeothece verrucosa]ADN17762.1 protein of unknown function DUF6 transmembrane [Gloeothece verrucosa PCC 7822]
MLRPIKLSQASSFFKSSAIPLLGLLLGTICLASGAIFIRLGETELSASVTIFNRFFFATPCWLLWELIKMIKLKSDEPSFESQDQVSFWDYFLLVFSGCAFVLNLLLWAWSLELISVANATVLGCFTTPFTSLGVWLLFGQRFDRRFLLGSLLAFGGVIAIGVGDFQLGSEHFWGDVLALLSALCLSVYILMLEPLEKKFSNSTLMVSNGLSGILLLLPLVWLRGDSIIPTTATGWVSALGLGIVSQVLGLGLFSSSVKYFSSAFLALFLLLDPLFAAIMAWLFLAEPMNLSNSIAFGLVLAGIYWAKSSPFAYQNV